MAAEAAAASAAPPAASEPAGAALARYYDLEHADELDDLDLYLALAARLGGPVLELAVGSGRVAVPLAAAGHAVTGIDRDRHMLARAEAAWQRHAGGRSGGSLRLLEADITDVALDERFSLVVLALNSILLLPGRDAQRAALATAARHLAPGGRAVIDAWLPAPDDLALYDGRLILDWVRTDPEDTKTVAKLTAARYEPATATAVVTTFFDAWPPECGPVGRVLRQDELHFLGAAELVALARGVGLTVETLGGDHAMTEFGPGSERAVVVCALL